MRRTKLANRRRNVFKRNRRRLERFEIKRRIKNRNLMFLALHKDME